MKNQLRVKYEDLGALNKPFFDDYKHAFADVLDSGWYVLGQQVSAFETAFADFCGAAHCVGVASGLDALVIALDILDCEAGAEVIVPSNTYIATILAILKAGLTPVLVEPDIKTYTIDPQKIKTAITSKTRAIMPVHLYGKMADMKSIQAIAKAHNLVTISDCAQAHGASLNGKKAGTWADMAAFSFYPTKNLGALGDGGAITTNNAEWAQKIKMYRNYGSIEKYKNEVEGYNSRLDEVQAAFLNIKLKKLDYITAHKQKLAKIYFENLSDKFILPVQEAGYEDVFHIFNIRHERRDTLKAYLLENGIGTEIHYPIAPHNQEMLKAYNLGKFPIAAEIHDTTLSLPISYAHSEADIQYVTHTLNKF